MKKILLSCLLTLGATAYGQYNFFGDFEEPNGEYGQFGGGSIVSAAACNGSYGGQSSLSGSTTQTGWMIMMDETGQISNGQKVNVSVKYKKNSGLAGTLRLAYFIQDPETELWNVKEFGPTINLTTAAITTCADLVGEIPSGELLPDGVNGIGVWIRRTSGTGAVYVDDINIVQEIATTAPACTTFTAPANGSTVKGGTYRFQWTPVESAVYYKITVGTTPGGSDIVDTTVGGSSYDAIIPKSQTLYAKIVPLNDIGEATGCSEITFQTNDLTGVCGPLTSSAPTAIAPIKSVTFGGVTNSSDASATTIGTFAPYEDFTSTVTFPVYKDQTSVPITVVGTTNGNTANGWAISVFIDWNDDGDFNDAGESYFNTLATMVRKGGVTDNPITLEANVAIPSGVSFGKKTMRVKYNFTSATSLNAPLAAACNDMVNGQAEDYVLEYRDELAVNDITKANIAVYPNPFKDVLKISDIKGIKSITINDMTGRQVKSLAPASELNLSNLQNGLYIVNLNMEDGSVKSIKAIKN